MEVEREPVLVDIRREGERERDKRDRPEGEDLAGANDRSLIVTGGGEAGSTWRS